MNLERSEACSPCVVETKVIDAGRNKYPVLNSCPHVLKMIAFYTSELLIGNSMAVTKSLQKLFWEFLTVYVVKNVQVGP
jgi:hypothetical protein